MIDAVFPATAARRTRALFTATILTGSFLLFLIQPMFARMVLPALGGAPAVWNSALLFYQAALLGGYVYAHALARLAPGAQLAIHLGLFALAALTLPVAVAQVPETWRAANPAVWLIGLFALSIGPVFLAVAAQAPLMQAWFARTGQPPFFLYAASNAGSLAALLAYPLVVEPLIGLADQSWLWTAGYALLALGVAACGLATMRLAPLARPRSQTRTPWPRRLRWGALAAVPSGLLISTTAFLTTDVMAMPLLWVVPLALYLLTYIIAFAGGGGALDPARFAPIMLVSFGAYVFLAEGLFAMLVAVSGLVVFFYIALALHGELARTAPEPARLTEFYLWIAIGGVVGGSLPALVAPLAFDWVYEHPILLVAAALLLPAQPLLGRIERLWRGPAAPWLRYAMPAVSLGLALWAGRRLTGGAVDESAIPAVALLGLAAIVAIGRPVNFAIQFALMLLALGGLSTLRTSADGSRERSFFGVYTIKEGTRARHLMHGTTLHGAQSRSQPLRPTTYYSAGSGVGRVLATASPSARVGVVGLGTGTLACYKRPGQAWTFFEIDPLVVDIARRRFSYLAGCASGAAIELGDARLRLAEGAPGRFDVLAVDAFSSDAIPLHLLTREAFAVYGRALAPDGLLLVHISNRFVDLEPVVAANVAAAGWAARLRDHRTARAATKTEDTTSDWVLIARDEPRLARALAAMPPREWEALDAPRAFEPWTDDHASVLGVIK